MDSTNSASFRVVEGEKHCINLTLHDWFKTKDFLVAACASTVVSWGNPRVSLRYTIKPTGKETGEPGESQYGFFVDPLEWPPNTTVSINISVPYYNVDYERVASQINYQTITNDDGQRGKKLMLIDDLFAFESKHSAWQSWDDGEIGLSLENQKGYSHLNQQKEIIVNVSSIIWRQCSENDLNIPLEACAALSQGCTASSLTDDVAEMYAAPDNFADLTLDMKDGMTLNGHRFILSARSPILKRKISELSGFSSNQSIKLDISAKPMTLVLHWIYTEKLHENIGKCWDQVLEAAKKLEMEKLSQILEGQVMTLVTPENMMEMYQIAKKNGMEKATKEISKYIKENLPD